VKTFLFGLGIGVGLGVLLASRRDQPASEGWRKRPPAGTAANQGPARFAASHAGHEQPGSRRDPEERPVDQREKEQIREKMLDKTLADSFPTSDPPSSIPDPSEDDSLSA
jgi:hypothetical protein